jgi:hypothetical protein
MSFNPESFTGMYRHFLLFYSPLPICMRLFLLNPGTWGLSLAKQDRKTRILWLTQEARTQGHCNSLQLPVHP